MTWTGFGFNGKTEIVFTGSKMNSEDYQLILEKHLLPSAQQISGRGWIFQQDNARIHTSRSSTGWFRKNNVRVLDWASRSPDANPIENLWGILAQRVYEGGRQFSNISQLKQAITCEWSRIPLELLQNLNNSVSERIAKIFTRNGAFIN